MNKPTSGRESIVFSDFIAFLDQGIGNTKNERVREKRRRRGNVEKSPIFFGRGRRGMMAEGIEERSRPPPIRAPLRGRKEQRGEHKTHFNWQCQTDKDGENEKFNRNCSSTRSRSVRKAQSRDTETG